MKFGEFVKEKGFCTEEQLHGALSVSKFRKAKIGRLMHELGFFDTKTLDSLLIQFLGPFSQRSYQELVTIRNPIPFEIKNDAIFTKLAVIPVHNPDSTLTVISLYFSDQLAMELETYFGKDIVLEIVRESVFLLLSGGSAQKKKHAEINISHDISSDQKVSEDNPYTRLIKNCFEDATKAKASDIHFEPFADSYLIRFRVHGVLADWKKLTPEHMEPLTAKLKWILNLDLAVAMRPQDGRATFERFGVDVRVNSLPIASGGEKIVLRLQYQEQKMSLTDLGLSPDKIIVLLDAIKKREGLIVISGPTGSGKTTTLYALLEEMDRRGKNISTLENPVEKALPRINQSNVMTKQDFDDFQRALMRQDPDVILLGEIRDRETAELSMKLASTGHLVLSTVHANGAREVLDRLLTLVWTHSPSKTIYVFL
jgi:type II secretory ATPase GspE/PulE/Tfp pilus assembly ATPase PilB-like protein